MNNDWHSYFKKFKWDITATWRLVANLYSYLVNIKKYKKAKVTSFKSMKLLAQKYGCKIGDVVLFVHKNGTVFHATLLTNIIYNKKNYKLVDDVKYTAHTFSQKINHIIIFLKTTLEIMLMSFQLNNNLKKFFLSIIAIIMLILALFVIIDSFPNKHLATPLNKSVYFNMSSDSLHDVVGEPDEISNNDIVLKTFEFYSNELKKNKMETTYVFNKNKLIEIDYSIDLNNNKNLDGFIDDLENEFIEFYKIQYNNVVLDSENDFSKSFSAGKGKNSVSVFICFESNILQVSCIFNG